MASPEASPHPLHLWQPRIGTESEFAALRRLFADCGFHDEGICNRLGIPTIIEFQSRGSGRTVALAIEEPVDVLIRLFLDGEFVAEDVLQAVLPPGALQVLNGLNMLATDTARPGEVYATLAIYPAAQELLMANDRANTPDGSRYQLPADVVYPSVVENVRHFLATLPESPCDALLDIGTGSGIAALTASRYARHAWGSDIAKRSVLFAEFNRRLNGIANVTIVEGDLYQPLEALTFDRIVAHPPYVPARKTGLIFRDGGEDGEQILRRIIEGLPTHLRVDGRFYSLVLGADLEGEPFEHRIRKWLGAAEGEFDLVMVSHSLRPPGEFIAHSLAGHRTGIKDLEYWAEIWRQRKVQFLFYGSILIRRHADHRSAITARVQKGEGFRPDHQEWLLSWETKYRTPGASAFLMGAHPAVAPGAELHVLHRLTEGKFLPHAFGVETKEPFVSDLRCGGWMVSIIAACDGSVTWREHFERATREGLISTETTEEDFSGILAMLVAQGILRIPEWPLPSAGI